MTTPGDPCPCGSGHPCEEMTDAQGINCGLVCTACKAEKMRRFNPWVFTGYTQEDVDEPIEPNDGGFFQ